MSNLNDMRETHYVLFCHSKKQLVIVFRGSKHNRNWLVLVSKDYVMEGRAYHELDFTLCCVISKSKRNIHISNEFLLKRIAFIRYY